MGTDFKFSIDKYLKSGRRPISHQISRPGRRGWATPEPLRWLCQLVVNNLPLPPQFKWTNMDVLVWIEKLGFPQYRVIAVSLNVFLYNAKNFRIHSMKT